MGNLEDLVLASRIDFGVREISILRTEIVPYRLLFYEMDGGGNGQQVHRIHFVQWLEDQLEQSGVYYHGRILDIGTEEKPFEGPLDVFSWLYSENVEGDGWTTFEIPYAVCLRCVHDDMTLNKGSEGVIVATRTDCYDELFEEYDLVDEVINVINRLNKSPHYTIREAS